MDSAFEWVKLLSHVWFFATPWTVAYKAPLFMEFSRQEYWRGLPFPSPGDLPHPGIEPGSPALQADALLSKPSITRMEKISGGAEDRHSKRSAWDKSDWHCQQASNRCWRDGWIWIWGSLTSLSLFTFMHWRRKWQPTPVFLLGESQGWWSLMGCRLWDRT